MSATAATTSPSTADSRRPSAGRGRLWAGRVLSAVPAIAMLASGAGKVAHAAPMVMSWGDKFGFPPGTLTGVGLLEIAVAVVYLIPRTAVLGAVLVAAYFGGAVATHVRIGDDGAAVLPVVLGVLAWAGLFLRDARVRALMPLVSSGARRSSPT